ncbi:hypothetical protein AJ80_06589 [Polytolypa hystricis UAMH7299]|uniref:Uncharacterized protein n=1 Tax=Polytolypa hystricis (strain UAMH7299) TaxID=1447883 RepID=A0A2B7XUZ0_POLH7|nr:hypothetical protein AJ80_06589 [Polytolypa hystricis UAMH7299]
MSLCDFRRRRSDLELAPRAPASQSHQRNASLASATSKMPIDDGASFRSPTAPSGDIFIGGDYPRLNSWISTKGGHRHVSTGFRKDKLEPKDEIAGQSYQRPSTPQSQAESFSSFSRLSSLPSQETSSPSRMPYSSGRQPSPPQVVRQGLTFEAMKNVQFDNRRGVLTYEIAGNGVKLDMAIGTPVWSGEHPKFVSATPDRDGRVHWALSNREPSRGSSAGSGGSERDRSKSTKSGE